MISKQKILKAICCDLLFCQKSSLVLERPVKQSDHLDCFEQQQSLALDV